MELWTFEFFNRTADITIKVQSYKYNVNKLILYISPIFRIMFSGKYSESSQQEIEITELNTNQWELILNYLYDKQLSIFSDLHNIERFDISLLDINNKLDLYGASDYLNIIELTNELIINISNTIYQEISSKNYDIADNNISKLPESILNYFSENLPSSYIDTLIHNFINLPDIKYKYPYLYGDSLWSILLKHRYNITSNNALEKFTNQKIYGKPNSELKSIDNYTKDELLQFIIDEFNGVMQDNELDYLISFNRDQLYGYISKLYPDTPIYISDTDFFD